MKKSDVGVDAPRFSQGCHLKGNKLVNALKRINHLVALWFLFGSLVPDSLDFLWSMPESWPQMGERRVCEAALCSNSGFPVSFMG